MGVITSLSDSCASFSIAQTGANSGTETTFTRKPGSVVWTREEEDCSFLSLSGKKITLRRAVPVAVLSSNPDQPNMADWIVVFEEQHPQTCKGQGGAQPTPATIYWAGCDGIQKPYCNSCRAVPRLRTASQDPARGHALLLIVIHPNGRAWKVQVLQSAGQDLDEIAVQTFRRWRYEKTMGPLGKPAAVMMNLPVDFNPHSVTAVPPEDQAQRAADQTMQFPAMIGRIQSLDDSCASFVVQSENEGENVEKTFARKPDGTLWSREADGCTFISLGGKKLLLRQGTRVNVRYAVEDQSNVVQWIVVLQEAPGQKCEGQGGAVPTPRTPYAFDCEGLPHPVCLHCPSPPYTHSARKHRVEGNLLLKVLISPDGSVSDVQVVHSLETSLDSSAVETVRTWRFKPFVGPNGVAISVELMVDVAFRIVY